jgi:uncharacterized SAM-binding protein YcdF (DUF218 family)
LVDELARAEEFEGEDLKVNEKFDYAIVLGGMSSYDERIAQPQFVKSSDRLWQTLSLFHQGRIQKIILSGGSGSINNPHHRESWYLKKFLTRMGIADSCIIEENQSKNTFENAVECKKICDSLSVESQILLVSSAFHLPRALACFKKQGLTNVRPYPTDRISGPRKLQTDHCIIPNSEALDRCTLLIHELVGHLIYKLRGYC